MKEAFIGAFVGYVLVKTLLVGIWCRRIAIMGRDQSDEHS